MKRMVFGLGTGRCGTSSLAKLLNKQAGFSADHEAVISPWEVDISYLKRTLRTIQEYKEDTVCDVSFWHLPYVDYIINNYPNTKFICLKRGKQETVDSYSKWTGYNSINGLGERNHWTARGSKYWAADKWRLDNTFDDCYPKYNLPRLEGIEQYWEDYYVTADKLELAYPHNFRIYDINQVLNLESTQKQMLEFIGIVAEYMVLEVNIRENKIAGRR